MFGRRRNKLLEQKLDEILRVQRLQGEAHSTIMSQLATVHDAVRKEAQGLQERFSFNNRPKP